MPLMQITVIPLGTSTTSVGEYIADIQRYLVEQDIDHTLNDMGTVLYGNISDLLSAAGKIHNLPFARGVERVVTQIIIDDRRDIDRKPGEKKLSVAARLTENPQL